MSTVEPQNREDRRHGVTRLAYSIDEAAEAIGVTGRHIRNLIERGELRSVRAGRRRLIPASVLESFLSGGPGEAA